MLDEELASGMLDKESYDAFTRRVDDVGTELRQMLKEMKAKGLKIAGYGAPAKGNTLLNYFGIGPSELAFLVDRNPLKHDPYSPGMKIPVRGTDPIHSERPELLLVPAWNSLTEKKN